MSEETPSEAAGLRPGSRLAGYRLEERIGRGGMAEVFRARDERLGRAVALKILAPALAADDAFRQRFLGESRAAAAVDDPHIIPVFEAGEAGGVLFIAMRYVPGGDVLSLLRRLGPLPPQRATEIIGQVASALDNAHAHELTHRDVKPANMLLGAEAGAGQPDHVYLSDFGLSKHALAATGLTAAGQFIGTLDYVAPEQIEGRPADGRADQYALACSAFELLSGAPPFRRDQGVAVVYAQLSLPPPALSRRRPGLPPGLDPVLARALAKSPADRFGSCGEFAAALAAALGLARPGGPAGQPDPAVPTIPAAPAGRPHPPTQVTGPAGRPGAGRPGARRRSRAVLPAVAVAAAAVLGGGGYALFGGGGSGPGGPGGGTVALPGCTTAAAAAPVLAQVKTASVTVGGKPFDVQVGRNGQFSFVSLGNAVAMLSNNGGGLGLTPYRTIPAPGASGGEAIAAIGGTQYLLVAGGSGAVVISVRAAKTPADPVVGYLRSPGGQQAQEVTVSPDSQFAFVTMKKAGQLAVFNLKKALASGFTSGFVGFVPVGSQPVGIGEHGSWLYVANLGPATPGRGTVSVIDRARAQRDPSRAAVIATAHAGCDPSRVLVSADGRTVWVTTQRSNALLAFSAARLRGDPAHALVAKVAVGRNPIGEIFIKGGAQIVVADSDNADPASARASLMVVRTRQALAGRPALVGQIRTGRQPRQFGAEGDTTLLVTNTGSGQLAAVSIGTIP